ncbi:ATP-binding protein [Nocardia miyunensis]|uniref:ATP-binding protein n=1 Tax=Nocardia miyunensis TaxID=282684 RepID=UPI00147222E3|nr:tetratricopeptide repeat protein [Nocardia miyunensis]
MRTKYLQQLHQSEDLRLELLHTIAQEITDQCGHGAFKAHRLAWGWTVAEAVEQFHHMCRREKLKPRGLVARSWMEWEAGSRPSFDYQDLLCRLFRTNPVQLGWAADYAPENRVITTTSWSLQETLSPTVQQPARVLMQLPPDTNDFTGRSDQVAHLITILGDSSGTGVPIATISGQAGIGKTALAVHVAHKVADVFPDGQLYANLRGAEARPLDPSEVVAGFLRELGVDGTDIPQDVDERARRYRACLAGRRVLVLLDNATDETQLRPLLPGTPSSAVLVTSRSHMTALSGPHAVHLGVLPSSHAIDLLTTLIGTKRASAEPDAVAEVVQLCGCLPLALRIAGARLMSRPSWSVAWFAGRLADESRRLDLLKAGDLEVRASFALSYESRSSEEQSAFRMLALTAAAFPAWNVAALLGTDIDDAEQLLESLVDAQLVEIAGADNSGRIRYRLHDLIRDFARECSTAFDTDDTRRSAAQRLANDYLKALQRTAVPSQPGASTGPSALADVGETDPRRWFAAEQTNVVAAIELAHSHTLWEETWQLSEALAPMFDWRADWQAWARTHNLALDAARRINNQRAQAITQRSLGALYRELGRYSEAADLLTQAIEIFDRLDDRHLWAVTMRNLGDTRRYQGRLHDALTAFSDSLEVLQAQGDSRSIAGALNGMADANRGLSRWEDAHRHFESSLSIYRSLDDRLEEARTHIRYGLVYRDRWHNDHALQTFEHALSTFRELDDQRWQARALRHIAVVHRNEGNYDHAHTAFDDCLALFDQLADRRGTAVTLRNRGDAHRLAGTREHAVADLNAAQEIFDAISDHRWVARTQLSMADLYRNDRQWDQAEHQVNSALQAFRSIGDRPAQGRALRQLALVYRDTGDLDSALTALTEAQNIFTELGDELWTARVQASRARTTERRGEDPTPEMATAQAICRRSGISTEHRIEMVLREW